MGKTESKNLDLKSKLSIVLGTIANAKKDIESFKTEFNDFKSDHAMSKTGLNSLNDEFYDYLMKSLKFIDNLIKLDNDILMRKNEYHVNIKNKGHIINNDTSITKNKCIKLKSMIRKNVNLSKNTKNNYHNIKKDNNNLLIDLKVLKEEYINKSNKRVKANKSSLKKTNACAIKDNAIVKNNVDACTSKNDLIVKNYVNAFTSTDDLIAKNVSVCTKTDVLLLKM